MIENDSNSRMNNALNKSAEIIAKTENLSMRHDWEISKILASLVRITSRQSMYDVMKIDEWPHVHPYIKHVN